MKCVRPIAVAVVLAACVATSGADNRPLGPTAEADVIVDRLPDDRGWVATLPGSCTGAPVLADLDGDGSREVVVPVIGRDPRGEKARHPRVSMSGQLFAFGADGKPHPRWPVVVVTANAREDRHEQLDWYWNFSPSVADIDDERGDELVLPTGTPAGTIAVAGNGRIWSLDADHGDPWSTPPLVDLDGDGWLDVVMGWTLASTSGGPVKTWPPERLIRSGYGPAVGDFLGTGTPAVYHPHYGEDQIVGGYDNTGKPLPGWPAKITGTVIFVSAGDLDGDGKAECVAPRQSGGLYAWRHDGTPVIAGSDGLFDANVVSGYAAPCIADVDADGKPEVVVWDTEKREIVAMRGDGTRMFAHPVPAEASARGGVSVGDVGGDGTADLFVGTTWVTFDPKTGKLTDKPLLAGEHPATTSQPTIADVDDDGNADVLIGTTDGRLFVYVTDQPYDAANMQWPTQSHDFRHTGFWTKPVAEKP